jgi:hypothetical protein
MHVTVKLPICKRVTFYKLGVYTMKVKEFVNWIISMLIATKNNPKGPNTNNTQEYLIDLSGCKFKFSMPMGNCYDMPNPQRIVIDKLNIYDYSSDGPEKSYPVLLVDRWFTYKGFLGENLGSVHFLVEVSSDGTANDNLFDLNKLKFSISSKYEKSLAEFNSTTDEYCKIESPSEYVITEINRQKALRYSIEQLSGTILNFMYAIPITDDRYIELKFQYASVKEQGEPWYKIAKELEKKIISTINISLAKSA